MSDKDKKRKSNYGGMVEFEVAHLGSGQLEAELKQKIEEMAGMVGDTDLYGDKAKGRIRVEVSIRREDRNVFVTSQISEHPPKVRPKSTLLWLEPGHGRLVTQDPLQVTIDDAIKRKREDAGDEDREQEETGHDDP